MDFPEVYELLTAAVVMFVASTVFTTLGFGIGVVAVRSSLYKAYECHRCEQVA